MADPVQAQVTTIAYKGPGSSDVTELSNLGAKRVTQLEPAGFEMGRSGRSFVGGLQLVTSGRAPLQDLPTTTAPFLLYNAANPGASPPRYLVVKKLSFSWASGTLGAFGTSIFGGVSPSVTTGNSIITANSTNMSIQATRGTGSSVAFLSQGTTGFPSGASWALLGGIAHGAASTSGIGYIVDISADPFIIPPGFAFAWGMLSDTGTTAKFITSAFWDEIEAVLP